jgi:hypothetical protein
MLPPAGIVYEIRHVFNLNLYNRMPQGSATRVCAEGRIEVEQPRASNDGTPPENAGTQLPQTGNVSASVDAEVTGAGVHAATTTPLAPSHSADFGASATHKRKHADGSPQKATLQPPSKKKQRSTK